MPSFKGQLLSGETFLKTCVSVNDQVIHGILTAESGRGRYYCIDGAPATTDIMEMRQNLCSRYVFEEASRLITVTEESFFKGLEKVLPGNRIIDVSGAIQDHVEGNGYTLVREFTGHGVGRELHEDPEIPNYRTKFRGPRLQNGMALAIEPMVIDGERYILLMRRINGLFTPRMGAWLLITRTL